MRLITTFLSVSSCGDIGAPRRTTDGRMSLVMLHVLRCHGLARLAIPSRFVATGRPALTRLVGFAKLGRDMSYTIVERGALNGTDYRIFFSE